MGTVLIHEEWKVVFPPMCACCLEAAGLDGSMQLELSKGGKTTRFQIPTCITCQRHWEQTNRYNRLMCYLMWPVVLVGLIGARYSYQVIVSEGWLKGLLVAVVGGALIGGTVLLIGKFVKPRSSEQAGHVNFELEPVTAEYSPMDPTGHTIVLTFVSYRYEKEFLKQNGRGQ